MLAGLQSLDREVPLAVRGDLDRRPGGRSAVSGFRDLNVDGWRRSVVAVEDLTGEDPVKGCVGPNLTGRLRGRCCHAAAGRRLASRRRRSLLAEGGATRQPEASSQKSYRGHKAHRLALR